LKLSIGNSCESFSISPGVNKIKLPLDVGSPHAVLYGSAGNIIVDFVASDFSYTGNSCSTYNFNYYTAMSP
jgi:glucan endo-1,3-alpha-glucosidase